MNKGGIKHSNYLSEHVSQPDWINEVEVVETTQVVSVVQKGAIFMKELGHYRSNINNKYRYIGKKNLVYFYIIIL